jgi:hypothetical protein
MTLSPSSGAGPPPDDVPPHDRGAADTARARTSASAFRFSTARNAAATDCSNSMYMSTIRCWSTWKLPIGTPNC